jgi:type I restriction enzyme S subunit
VRITDISADGHIRQDQKVSVDRNIKEKNYLKEGDIVLARTGASVGKAYKYKVEDGRLVFAGFLIRVRPDKRKLNAELLFQFLSSERYWGWVIFSSTRSGQPGINGNEYASLPISLPPTLKEQQKIADCLSSLDALIAAQTEKLDALKTHKKGLMQQLFPGPEAVGV